MNFWYMDTYETPQVVPVEQSVHCSKLMCCTRFRNKLNEKNQNILFQAASVVLPSKIL